MDDDRENRFLLDTSIIVPIAIAGGIAFLIVAFVYCCRHAFSKRSFSQFRHQDSASGSTLRNRSDGTHHNITSNQEREVRTGGGLPSIISAAMTGYLPRHGRAAYRYPPPSHHSRTNYNSTQTTPLQYPHEFSAGPTPSAPLATADAPPPYSVAMKYPSTGGARNTATSQNILVTADPNAPPPPYSPHFTTATAH